MKLDPKMLPDDEADYELPEPKPRIKKMKREK